MRNSQKAALSLGVVVVVAAMVLWGLLWVRPHDQLALTCEGNPTCLEEEAPKAPGLVPVVYLLTGQ